MKQFDVPTFYRSPIISKIKEKRRDEDRSKKDFAPTRLDFNHVTFLIARHFGFCYGVENAIEIIYNIIEDNKGKRIFLLSEMIHNPEVNQDLMENGIQFIQDTKGNQLIEWNEITSNDIVVIPAFGTTVEIEALLNKKGIEIHKYNTTCPFVERVWKKAEKLGASESTIIIHGKFNHEETRATFSHSKEHAPSLIIENMEEAKLLADFIIGEKGKEAFFTTFENRYSEGFDPSIHLQKIGVVNQTTILATETQAISDYLKVVIEKQYAEDRFMDTRDTLCYATLDNQRAVLGMLEEQADFALVIGGYNSSNTSHLAELCEQQLPTYYISSAKEIENRLSIHHYNYKEKERICTASYFPETERKPVIMITSGASCPDAIVDRVIAKIVSFFGEEVTAENVERSLKKD